MMEENNIIILKLYNRYLLKPICLIFIAFSIFYFLSNSWLMGIFFIFSLFLLGIIGQSLHPEMSFSELSKGPTRLTKEQISNTSKKINHQDYYLISKTSLMGSWLIALVLVVFSWHYNLRWYFIVISGVVGMLLYMLISLLILLLIRRKLGIQ